MTYQYTARPLTLFSNPEMLHHVAFRVVLMLSSNLNGVKHFQGQKGPIWTFVIYIWNNISETVHATTNVSIEGIYEVIHRYMIFQSTSLSLTSTYKGEIKVTELLYLINNATYDQSPYEIHIWYVIYGYSVYLITFDL